MEDLTKSLKEFSLLQYMIMEKSKDFGEAGALRVKFDFLRSLFGLPSEHRLTSDDWEKFNRLLPHLTKELRDREKEFYFTLKGKRFKRNQVDEINRLLEESGSSNRLFIGSRKEGFPIILFGPVKELKSGEHAICLLEKEEVRSPAAVLSIAAITNQQHEIVIRKESLEAVFFGKWGALLSKKDKNKVLELYKIDSFESLKERQPLFLEEMIETTVRHETSHVRFSKDYPDQDLIALSKLLSATTSSSTLETLEEAIIDWMPEGVVLYLAELAKKDYPKAKRMFYRYLADSWFCGSLDQEYMNGLTDLLAKPLLSYIQRDGEVDFTKIANDSLGVYEYFLSYWEKTVLSVKKMIENTSFVADGIEVSFETLARAQIKSFRKQNNKISPASPLYRRYFWANILNYAKNCAPEVFEEVESFLRKTGKEALKLSC